MNTYPALARLESLELRGMKLGLAAIDALCERLGRPEKRTPSVLVGGTNGKGSTAATLSAIVKACGLRAGLYTSPHLIDVTERIRVEDEDVTGEELDQALARVFAVADASPTVAATYFEAATAAAFLIFFQRRLDLAILEVGLGGRLAATNVAPGGLARASASTRLCLARCRGRDFRAGAQGRVRGNVLRTHDAAAAGQPDDAASRFPPGLERRSGHPRGGAIAGAIVASDSGRGRGGPAGRAVAGTPRTLRNCGSHRPARWMPQQGGSSRSGRIPFGRGTRRPLPPPLRRHGGQGRRRDRRHPLPGRRARHARGHVLPPRGLGPGACRARPACARKGFGGRECAESPRDSSRRRRRRTYNRGRLSLSRRRGAGVFACRRTAGRTDVTTATAQFTREHFERLEEERLAVFASKSAQAVRPYGPARPMEGDVRTEYARDRDRIIHSRAFRRLKHKTQVFIPYEGDHFRTRLTHTIEVSQIARSAARALGLNEDLAEAIALGHDLGHTPFGHSGESVLDRLLRESHPEAGGFKHNFQSVRVVDRLEKRYEEPGLNLTHDVREGMLKHTAWPKEFPFPLDFVEGLRFESGGTLEAQLVNWSDEIAQQTHDLEDGLPL